MIGPCLAFFFMGFPGLTRKYLGASFSQHAGLSAWSETENWLACISRMFSLDKLMILMFYLKIVRLYGGSLWLSQGWWRWQNVYLCTSSNVYEEFCSGYFPFASFIVLSYGCLFSFFFSFFFILFYIIRLLMAARVHHML